MGDRWKIDVHHNQVQSFHLCMFFTFTKNNFSCDVASVMLLSRNFILYRKKYISAK